MDTNQINSSNSLKQVKQLELEILGNLRRLVIYNQSLKLKKKILYNECEQWKPSQENLTSLESNTQTQELISPDRHRIIPKQVIRFFGSIFNRPQSLRKAETTISLDQFDSHINYKFENKSKKVREAINKILQTSASSPEDVDNIRQILTQKKWLDESLITESDDSPDSTRPNSPTVSLSQTTAPKKRSNQTLSR